MTPIHQSTERSLAASSPGMEMRFRDGGPSGMSSFPLATISEPSAQVGGDIVDLELLLADERVCQLVKALKSVGVEHDGLGLVRRNCVVAEQRDRGMG
jgi:hypothetical protein